MHPKQKYAMIYSYNYVQRQIPMKRTAEEHVKSRLINIGKKNRALKLLVLPALCVSMAFFSGHKYCKNNVKRFVMIAMSFVIFPVYSSFSFPMFITGQADKQHGLNIDGAENITLVQETEVNLDEIELPDDFELLDSLDESEETDYLGTSHGLAIADKYNASEILESYSLRDSANAASESEVKQESGEVFSADDWRLVLINKQNSIPDDYTFTLGTITGNLKCDERIIEDLLDMLQTAKEDGINLNVCSPYRDMERQVYLFNRKIKLYMNRGFSYMEAYRLANEYVTVPGASEHQLGLALDIVSNDYWSLDAGFADTDAGKWLAEHSCEYGFILRYPLGKEYITGIEYEPWHFRYVGVEAAMLIARQGITLEEFWEEYVD